ncbi:MAG TPA: MFS transporter [Cellvibrionaceae bacterium]|nr:MFS transporter [Cellvibrionaceae bacterium]HMW47151.1 MFS transporter [Cellvibrionaceae bacterium]HMW71617.1 MFS transporter [Cellvibrionaceae bacterium]HNG58568.1 MFS transporter [Cellvibrionaceae bacterium]
MHTNPIDETALYARVTWRLLPILFLCYVASYLDRVNVGFAKLQMLNDLKFSETVYGLGAGIFFIGYFIFEVPSNIALHKVGARLWIARIMITWALVSAAMVWVTTPLSFYILRFLLGAAEAGFFPGVILYLTYWFPAHRRGKITALFMTGVPISGVIGGPLSGWIGASLPGVYGLAGWQWMFILEAIPSLLLGIVVIIVLADGIHSAHWLNDAEKTLLDNNIRREEQSKSTLSARHMLADSKVWLMAGIYFCFVMGLYGVSFWLPTLIHNLGVENSAEVGWLTAIPYAVASITMILLGHSADKHRERRWHLAVPALLGGAGLILSALWAHNTLLAMAALSLATAGIISILPLFWSLPTAILGGVAAAAGIALINSLGNLAGFLSPYLVGWLKDATASTDSGLFMLAGFLFLGAALTLTTPKQQVNA